MLTVAKYKYCNSISLISIKFAFVLHWNCKERILELSDLLFKQINVFYSSGYSRSKEKCHTQSLSKGKCIFLISL